MNTTAHPMPIGTVVDIQIERLGDGSISFKVVNRSTGRICVDRAFVARECLQEVSVRVIPEGIVYSAR